MKAEVLVSIREMASEIADHITTFKLKPIQDQIEHLNLEQIPTLTRWVDEIKDSIVNNDDRFA